MIDYDQIGKWKPFWEGRIDKYAGKVRVWALHKPRDTLHSLTALPCCKAHKVVGIANSVDKNFGIGS